MIFNQLLKFEPSKLFVWYLMENWTEYSLPSINVNPREWIKVNIYRGVNT